MSKVPEPTLLPGPRLWDDYPVDRIYLRQFPMLFWHRLRDEYPAEARKILTITAHRLHFEWHVPTAPANVRVHIETQIRHERMKHIEHRRLTDGTAVTLEESRRDVPTYLIVGVHFQWNKSNIDYHIADPGYFGRHKVLVGQTRPLTYDLRNAILDDSGLVEPLATQLLDRLRGCIFETSLVAVSRGHAPSCCRCPWQFNCLTETERQIHGR